MARPLSHFARAYLTDKAAFASRLTVPVLLWEATAELKPGEAQWDRTESGVSDRIGHPRPGEPLVFELKKTNKKNNPFSMGITLGRVETNDIVIDDASISRFHAWFQNDPKAGWIVVDAESKNGCTVDGKKLLPNKKTPVKPNARLRFGEIDLLFLSPDGLAKRLEAAFK